MGELPLCGIVACGELALSRLRDGVRLCVRLGVRSFLRDCSKLRSRGCGIAAFLHSAREQTGRNPAHKR